MSGMIAEGASRASKKRGAMAVELAILLPAFLLLTLGALEFGRLFQVWVVVHNAAREGARYAAVGTPAAEIQNDVVLRYLDESGLGGGDDVQLPTADQIVVETGARGEPVSVWVPVWVEVRVPIVSQLLPENPMRVAAYTTMRMQ